MLKRYYSMFVRIGARLMIPLFLKYIYSLDESRLGETCSDGAILRIKREILENINNRMQLLEHNIQEEHIHLFGSCYTRAIASLYYIDRTLMSYMLGSKELAEYFCSKIDSGLSQVRSETFLTRYTGKSNKERIKQMFNVARFFKKLKEESFRIFKLLTLNKITQKNMKTILKLMAKKEQNLNQRDRETNTINWIINEMNMEKLKFEAESLEICDKQKLITHYHKTSLWIIKQGILITASMYENQRYYYQSIINTVLLNREKKLVYKYNYLDECLKVIDAKKTNNILLEAKFIINLIFYIYDKTRLFVCNIHNYRNDRNAYRNLMSMFTGHTLQNLHRHNFPHSDTSNCKYMPDNFISIELFLNLLGLLPWKETQKIISENQKKKLKSIFEIILCCLDFQQLENDTSDNSKCQYSKTVTCIKNRIGFYYKNLFFKKEVWIHISSKQTKKLSKWDMRLIEMFWRAIGNLWYILENIRKIHITITDALEEDKISMNNSKELVFKDYAFWDLCDAKDISLGEVVNYHIHVFFIGHSLNLLVPKFIPYERTLHTITVYNVWKHNLLNKNVCAYKLLPPGVYYRRYILSNSTKDEYDFVMNELRITKPQFIVLDLEDAAAERDLNLKKYANVEEDNFLKGILETLEILETENHNFKKLDIYVNKELRKNLLNSLKKIDMLILLCKCRNRYECLNINFLKITTVRSMYKFIVCSEL